MYSGVPVEYPPTTDEGVAIIFSLEKIPSSADVLHTKAAEFFHDVRFIIINRCLLPYQNYSFFVRYRSNILWVPQVDKTFVIVHILTIPRLKKMNECQGIMICEQTDPALANKCHKNVDFDSDEFQRVKKNECLIDRETNTYM